MLPESITVATGRGKGDGGQQLHLVDGDSLAATGMTFPDGKIAGLKEREQLIPIVQEHAHGVGDIRMDQLHIVEYIVHNNAEMFVLLLQIRYHLHRR
jgi:hypothetical protein